MAHKITPFLMFDGSAEEAMRLHVALFHGSEVKRIENVTWSTKCRGDLFIDAGVGYGDEQWLQEEFGLRVPPDPPRGAFVAMCRLVDVVTESDDRWFEGE